MKTKLVSILAALCALAFSGCTSTPTGTVTKAPSPAEFAAAVIEPLATGTVPIVLAKNPQLAGAIEGVANLIPVVLGGAQLTPEGITAALTSLNAQGALGMTPEVVTLLATTLSVALLEYQRAYGVTVALNTDPNVQLIANAFANGLRNGVAVWRAAHPPAP